MIDAYSFGLITIDGRQYTKDVIITSNGVLSPWWRRKGHSLDSGDLESIMNDPPQILVIGMGSFGVMKVPESTLEFLREKGIEARVMRTGKAVEEFNRLLSERGPDRIMAALHLTC